MSRNALCLVATGATIAIVDTAALAASDESHGAAHEDTHAETHAAGGHHAPSVTELLFPAINFAIFAVIIVKYVIPALREYLRRRSDDITKTITESSAALAAAEATITAARARSATLAAEREAIRTDLVTAATRQGARLRAQAEETGKRRLADAALVAEQERRRALQEVRAEVAALATELATARLRSALSADDQRAFVREFLKEAPSR